MTSQLPVQCLACAHSEGSSICRAFPHGIPDDIALFGADHRKPWPNDQGIRFEQRDTDKARQAFADWQGVFGG